MDVAKLLEELRAYKERLDEAIVSLERLAQGRGAAPKTRSFSPQTRKKMAQAQRKRWAQTRKTNNPPE